MKIIVDAFGGDNAPLEILKGCEMAVSEYDLNIILVGNIGIIKDVAEKNNISLTNMDLVNADDVISMEDQGVEIIKSKKECSMAKGLQLLAEDKGDAFISAGNSGALVVGSTFIVKRIRGIKRCAFAPVIPNDGGCFMLIDSGANIDCRPDMLAQFGLMGSVYMEKVMGVKNPRVGLANVGEESHKGTELQIEAYKMLKESGINFIGNVEARDIPVDAADVIVADGFTGNMLLKMYEGVAMTLMKKIKGIFKKNIKTKLAAAMILPEMMEIKKSVDYNEYGGAPILGVSKPVFKAHGNSKAKTFKNALKLTVSYVESNVVEELKETLASLESK